MILNIFLPLLVLPIYFIKKVSHRFVEQQKKRVILKALFWGGSGKTTAYGEFWILSSSEFWKNTAYIEKYNISSKEKGKVYCLKREKTNRQYNKAKKLLSKCKNAKKAVGKMKKTTAQIEKCKISGSVREKDYCLPSKMPYKQ